MDLLVRNRYTRDVDLCRGDDYELRPGDEVVYDGRYGLDLGVVLGPVPETSRSQWKSATTLRRPATAEDSERWGQLDRDADELLRICRERVDAHGLDMRAVGAHFLFDESKLIVFFVSDHRIDFRNLVRDLASRIHTRVELRQIGVRDETRMVGGIGICGRRVCCNVVSDRLEPVSIRMAKDQNYSLNSTKVSGPCGRLLCCLAYEHGFYRSERQRYPREGVRVAVEEETFRVVEVNVISGHVRLSGPEGRHATYPICAFEKNGGGGRDAPVWAVTNLGCRGTAVHEDEHSDHPLPEGSGASPAQ